MQPHERLEHELARWPGTGRRYGPEQIVACSSGTAALHLAMEAMQMAPGSTVLMPDYTMVACARAVTLAGLVPELVDCDDRLLMNQDLISAVPGAPSALMLVSLYGRSSRPDEYTLDWLHRMDARLIEDLSEIHGVPPHPATDAACWSFYKNKIIAGQEGGAVAFKDPEHARVARSLRSLGDDLDEPTRSFRHRPRGHNYRLAPALAEAVLPAFERYIHELPGEKWEYDIKVRRQIENAYDQECPPEWKMPMRDAPWVYDVRVPGLTRSRMLEVVGKLNSAGVEARAGFCPTSWQAEYGRSWVVRGRGHAAGSAANEVFYLPLTPGKVTKETVRGTFGILSEMLVM